MMEIVTTLAEPRTTMRGVRPNLPFFKSLCSMCNEILTLSLHSCCSLPHSFPQYAHCFGCAFSRPAACPNSHFDRDTYGDASTIPSYRRAKQRRGWRGTWSPTSRVRAGPQWSPNRRIGGRWRWLLLFPMCGVEKQERKSR